VSSPAKPRRSLRALVTLLLPALAGAGFGYLVAGGAMQWDFLKLRMHSLGAWDLLALPLIILFVIAIHEAGHLLGGLRRGMRFLLYVVGPFQFSRTPSGIRFNWVFNLGTLGGLAACLPKPGAPLPPQLLSLIAGGPLASLLLMLAGLGLALLVEGRPAAYALITAFLSGLIFLVTAFPMRNGGFMSDGAQWLEVRRGGKAVEERQLLTVLMAESYGGCRPGELDGDLVEQVLAFEDDPLRRVASRLIAFLHRLDRGDLPAAGELADWLAEHIEAYPDGFRQGIAVELALFAGLHRQDREAAATWLKRSRGGIVDSARRALAEATVAALQGDSGSAEAALQRARRALRRGSDAGLARMTSDQIGHVASGLAALSTADIGLPVSQFPAQSD